MARHTVQHRDESEIGEVRSITCQYEQSNENAQNSYGECWICLQNSSENRLDTWVHPCRCTGSMKWVHNECLCRWIDSKQNGNALKPVTCPQCRTKYQITVSSMGLLTNLFDKFSLFAQRFRKALTLIGAFIGLYYCCIIYGLVTVLQILKREQVRFLLAINHLLFLYVFLPIIPIVLVIGRTFQWENILIRILYRRRFFRRIPLLNYLIAYSHDDNSLRAPRSAFVQILDLGRVSCGAALLPTVAYFVGYVFYRSVENNLLRLILGGATVIIVKGILKIFLMRQKLITIKGRTILDYTKENMEKYGNRLVNNTGVPTAAIN